MHTSTDRTPANTHCPIKARTRQKGPASALMSPRNFSIIHKSQEVLTAWNIPIPYLQCEVGCKHWSAIRGFTQRHDVQSRENELKWRQVAANEKLIPIVTVLITVSVLPGLSRDDGRNKIMAADKKEWRSCCHRNHTQLVLLVDTKAKPGVLNKVKWSLCCCFCWKATKITPQDPFKSSSEPSINHMILITDC